MNLKLTRFTVQRLLAVLLLIGVLPAKADQGDFTYIATPTEVTITGYTGAGGAVTIPSSIDGLPVTIIGRRAFASIPSVTSVTIPNSVLSIESDAFYQCYGLTSFTIPNSVLSIGDASFSNCYGLTSFTIGKNVISIGIHAFSLCPLTSLTIPDSVLSIGSDAFFNCSDLSGLYFLGNAPSYPEQEGIFGINNHPRRVYYTPGTTGWKPLFSRCPTALWTPLNITYQPTSININQGGTVIFGVMATGNAVRYQWQKEGLDIPGATSELLFLSNIQPSAAAGYRAVVSDDTGSMTSVVATLTVNTPPLITVQPASMTASQGGSVTLNVTATGALSYRWQRNGSDVSNATSASLTLSGLQVGDAGSYTVIASNLTGSVTSNPAVITVNAPFRQAQYDEVLLVGRTQVTNSPNSYGLYSLSQVQALHVGTPLLSKDPVSGKFKLTVGVEKSTNLVNFSPMAIPVGATTINTQGKMEFEFTAPDNAAFYRLESR